MSIKATDHLSVAWTEEMQEQVIRNDVRNLRQSLPMKRLKAVYRYERTSGAYSVETPPGVKEFFESVELLETGLPITKLVATEHNEELEVTLVLEVRDRNTGEFIFIRNERRISWYVLKATSLDVKALLRRWLWDHLLDAFKHELEEALFIDGVRAHDPHPAGF